jgi:hypothetical protein
MGIYRLGSMLVNDITDFIDWQGIVEHYDLVTGDIHPIALSQLENILNSFVEQNK